SWMPVSWPNWIRSIFTCFRRTTLSLNRNVTSKCCSKLVSRSAKGTMASLDSTDTPLLLTSMGLMRSACPMSLEFIAPPTSTKRITDVAFSNSLFIIDSRFLFYFCCVFALLCFANLQLPCLPVDLRVQDLAQRPGQDVQIIAPDSAGYKFIFILLADDHVHAKGALDAPGDLPHRRLGKGKFVFRP